MVPKNVLIAGLCATAFVWSGLAAGDDFAQVSRHRFDLYFANRDGG